MSLKIKKGKYIIDVSTFTTSERYTSGGISQMCTVIGKASGAQRSPVASAQPEPTTSLLTWVTLSQRGRQELQYLGHMFNKLRLKQLTDATGHQHRPNHDKNYTIWVDF